MKHKAGLLAVIVLSSFFLIAPAEAQEQPAGEGALYFTNKVDAAPETGIKRFQMTDQEPAAAAPLKAYAQTSAFASTYQTQFEYKFPEPATLTGKYTLKTWVSCDVLAPFRPAYQNTANDLQGYRFVLFKGTTEVGRGVKYTSLNTCTGPSVVQELSAEVTLEGVEFSKNEVLGIQPLIWTVTTPEAVAKNVHFLVGGGNRLSGIRGPGLPGADASAPVDPTAAVVTFKNETLEGSTAEIRESFSNATNAVHNYNWTTNGTSFVISANATTQNGSVEIEVYDGAGERVYYANLSSANNTGGDEFRPPVLVDAAAGQWQIRLNLSAYVGDLFVTVGVAPESSSTPTATNETAAPQTTSGGGIPALPFLGAILAVAFVVAARRRLA